MNAFAPAKGSSLDGLVESADGCSQTVPDAAGWLVRCFLYLRLMSGGAYPNRQVLCGWHANSSLCCRDWPL